MLLTEKAMILSQDDAALFFRLMWGLQFYINQQLQLLPNVKSRDAYSRLDIQVTVVVRDALWKSPELIDAYVKENPDGLSSEELSIIGRWKGFVAGKFCIFRYLKDYAIFIGSSKVYAVLGLYDRFEDLFQGRPLPILVEAVLLPYKGKIIHDGLYRSYSIDFGRGIRSSLNEDYAAAKQNGRIILALEPEAFSAKPAQPSRQLDKESEAIVAEIMRATERLRGGTAIQRTAFALLRASAKVVQAALQSADQLDELWRLGHQVHTAVNRFQKVLGRANH